MGILDSLKKLFGGGDDQAAKEAPAEESAPAQAPAEESAPAEEGGSDEEAV